jgi:hypothetical protein
MTILSKFRNSSQPQTSGNLALKLKVEEKALPEILPNPSGSALPDQAEIKEWLEERSGIIEFEGKLTRQESDNLATFDGSKRFCPSCRAGRCKGCQLAEAFEFRKAAARAAAEQARVEWKGFVCQHEKNGLPHGEAVKLASKKILSIYRLDSF